MDDRTDDDRVNEMVRDYFARLAAGQLPTLDEVCGRHPHLRKEVARRVAKMEAMDRFLMGENNPRPNEPGGVPQRFTDLKFHRKGGMGIIYLARDREADRTVAYKVLIAGQMTTVLRGEFVREAAITARLHHPGILPVYGMVTDEPSGLPAYATRFVDGYTLHSVIKEAKPGDRTRLLRQFVSIARAVEYAHAHGVRHNDLKSDNVMVTKDHHTVFVIDWGLAQELPAPLSSAAAASDIRGLGCILQEILTGKFSRTLLDDKLFDGCPPGLVAVVRAAMGEPAPRYSSVSELANDMESWLETGIVSVHRDRFRVRAARWVAAHPAWTTGVLAGVLVAAVGIVAAFVVRDQRRELRTTAEREAIAEEQRLHNAGVAWFGMASSVDLKLGAKALVTVKRLREAISQFQTAVTRYPTNRSHTVWLAYSRLSLSYALVRAQEPGWSVESLELLDQAEPTMRAVTANGDTDKADAISGVKIW